MRRLNINLMFESISAVLTEMFFGAVAGLLFKKKTLRLFAYEKFF